MGGNGGKRQTAKEKKPRLKSKPIPVAWETMTVLDLNINHRILMFHVLRGIGHVALGPHKMANWN